MKSTALQKSDGFVKSINVQGYKANDPTKKWRVRKVHKWTGL